MRFVHVEDFFHPDAGYQLNLLAKLQVQQGHEVFIIASEMHKVPNHLKSFSGDENIEQKDSLYFSKTGVKIIRCPSFFWYSGRAILKNIPLTESVKNIYFKNPTTADINNSREEIINICKVKKIHQKNGLIPKLPRY